MALLLFPQVAETGKHLGVKIVNFAGFFLLSQWFFPLLLPRDAGGDASATQSWAEAQVGLRFPSGRGIWHFPGSVSDCQAGQ